VSYIKGRQIPVASDIARQLDELKLKVVALEALSSGRIIPSRFPSLWGKGTNFRSPESVLLLEKLRTRKPSFQSHRVHGSVRVDVDGTTVGSVDVAEASKNVGLSFQSRKAHGGQMLPMCFAKPDQHERKKMAYVCSFLGYLFDDRPSEERRVAIVGALSNASDWYSKFSKGHLGESEAYHLYQELVKECPTLIDVFHDVDEAIKSARREDVAEAVSRVQKDLPFLVGKLSEEEWAEMYRQAVVDGVHGL